MQTEKFEVLLNLRINPNEFPPQLPERITKGKGYPYNRMGSIIELMRKEGAENPINLKDFFPEDTSLFTPGKIYSLAGSDKYFYCFLPGNNQINTYMITTVTNLRPWEIRVKDGFEYVYFYESGEDFKIIDSNLNYAVER